MPDKPVTDGADGAHEPGCARVVAQRAPQSADVHIHDALVAEEVLAPHLGQQSAPGEDPPRDPGHREQQIEVESGQLHRPVGVDKDGPCLGIDSQSVEAQYVVLVGRLGAAVGAPQDGAHP